MAQEGFFSGNGVEREENALMSYGISSKCAPPCLKSTFTVIAFPECAEGFVSKFLLRKLAVGETAIALETKPSFCFCSLLVPKDTRLIFGFDCTLLPYLRNPRLTID